MDVSFHTLTCWNGNTNKMANTTLNKNAETFETAPKSTNLQN